MKTQKPWRSELILRNFQHNFRSSEVSSWCLVAFICLRNVLFGFGEQDVGMFFLNGHPSVDSTMQDDKHDATQLLIIRSEGMLSQSAEEIIFTDQQKSA